MPLGCCKDSGCYIITCYPYWDSGLCIWGRLWIVSAGLMWCRGDKELHIYCVQMEFLFSCPQFPIVCTAYSDTVILIVPFLCSAGNSRSTPPGPMSSRSTQPPKRTGFLPANRLSRSLIFTIAHATATASSASMAQRCVSVCILCESECKVRKGWWGNA